LLVSIVMWVCQYLHCLLLRVVTAVAAAAAATTTAALLQDVLVGLLRLRQVSGRVQQERQPELRGR
jgi:UDP-N-acetylmuramyl pentapeptide synthase